MLQPVPEQASLAECDATLKTCAILVGSQKLIDAELPANYVQACEGWYTGLSSSDRVVATIVISSWPHESASGPLSYPVCCLLHPSSKHRRTSAMACGRAYCMFPARIARAVRAIKFITVLTNLMILLLNFDARISSHP